MENAMDIRIAAEVIAITLFIAMLAVLAGLGSHTF